MTKCRAISAKVGRMIMATCKTFCSRFKFMDTDCWVEAADSVSAPLIT